MARIEAGKYVELVYEIFVVNGDEQTSVFKFSKERPDAFVFGLDVALLEEFQNHVMGLEQGETFDFTLKPEQAFGMKNPDLVVELEKQKVIVLLLKKNNMAIFGQMMSIYNFFMNG